MSRKVLQLRYIGYSPEAMQEHNCYGDVVPPRHGGPSAKYTYLTLAKRFLRQVAANLPVERPKFHVNPGGIAVPGEVSMGAWHDPQVLYVTTFLGPSHVYIMWRIGRRPYAIDGRNNWVEDGSMSAVRLSAVIRKAQGWR